ncbi:MAG TPA: DUF4326 domain-containing protein [Pyrinomonadaceae bacterium]|nr:DUF4326 domain-containing protein [Pyrinomonadaceae bacterium]
MKAPRARLRLSAAEELENVAVVNRHTYSGPRDNSFVYIGRGTPLGNQWSHVNGTAATYRVATREEAVSRFNTWLSEQIEKSEGPAFAFIQQLLQRVANGEHIRLACSCVPKLCHGDVVKATLELLIHNHRHPERKLEREPLQLLQSPDPTAKPKTIDQTAPRTVSARAEQARAEVQAIDQITDDLTIYNVPEGVTRAAHASTLHSFDQFVRDAFERGATLTDNVLSIPRDPDARPRDETKVTIGTEAHAINFVRSFIADQKLADEKGKLLYDIANKACGQWIDSDGRLTIFNYIYTEIRQDETGLYRTNEQKAEVIDRVLEEAASWAQPLPEPAPDPTREEIHQYTLDHFEEYRTTLQPENLLVANEEVFSTGTLQPSAFDLESTSYGLATLGEISGFHFPESETFDASNDLSFDESQVYANLFENAISDPLALEGSTPEVADRQSNTGIMLDATFERTNLGTLPPALPDSLSPETQIHLMDHVLPAIDSQLERGVSKNEILSSIYLANREADRQQIASNVNQAFTRAGAPPTDSRITRLEELTAISSLRILVGTEYRQQTQHFSREAILWAKDNYRVDPDRLRAGGKLPVGKYQNIVTAQNDARIAWLEANPGQAVPTRAEITSINRLEQAGHQLNNAIAALNPTPQQHAQVLDQLQSRLASTNESCKSLLHNYEAAEQLSRDLAAQASNYAEAVRATPDFRDHKETLLTLRRENSINEHRALHLANNVRVDLYGEPLPSFFSQDNEHVDRDTARLDNDQPRSLVELWAKIQPLEEKFTSQGVDPDFFLYLQQQARMPGGVDSPLMKGVEEYDGKFYPLEPVNGFPSALGPENGFATPEEAQSFIDGFSQERSVDEQQLLNLYAELAQHFPESLVQEHSYHPDPPSHNLGPGFDWQRWEDQQIAQFEQRELSQELTQTNEETRTQSFDLQGLQDRAISVAEERYENFLHDLWEEQQYESQPEIVRYPELTGESRPLSHFAQLSSKNDLTQRDTRQTLTESLINPQIQAAQEDNNAQLRTASNVFTQLTGVKINNAGEARQAIASNLQGLENASQMIDATRTRFGIDRDPTVVIDNSPAPVYLSLTSNPNTRLPLQDSQEYKAILVTAEQCRVDTTIWSGLLSPQPISGFDQERADTARFISSYIDFRLQDHATQELARNPTFREYSERIATAPNADELLKVTAQIKQENYGLHQQSLAHRADPQNVPAPNRKPLTVMEMREVLLTTTPTRTASRAQHIEMRDIVHATAVFGKEKEDRVKLLAEGKLPPSATLQKLLENLQTRQTETAVNHFYRSLRTPASELRTQNSFDLCKAHARLPQYERDYLHRYAIAQRYELVNKQPGTQLTPETASKAVTHVPDSRQSSTASSTAFYREYYGRADWLEAKQIVTAVARQNNHIGPTNTLDRATIVPDLKDVEVHAISHIVNNFDQNRQIQVADYLKNSPDEHLRALGDMITVSFDIRAAGPGEIKEIQIPLSYHLSADSVKTIVSYTQQDSDRTATKIPSPQLAELRREVQAQAWRDTTNEILKDPTSILDSPAQTLYQARDLSHAIQQTAALQEKARTAFQTLNAHTTICINRVEQTLRARSNDFRSAEQQQTTRELVKSFLDPKLAQSKDEFLKANAPEYAVIQQTLTLNDRDRAAQLREYAANTRLEYLATLSTLDRDYSAFKSQQPELTVQSRSAGPSTFERYTVARDNLERDLLANHVQQMFQSGSVPNIGDDKQTSLTVKELIPTSVRNQTFEIARERAWQSLAPPELNDREAPPQLVTTADQMMDRVADAQTIELELEATNKQLASFVGQHVANLEAPIKEERANLAYDDQFRNTLSSIAFGANESRERADAAVQVLETLNKGELDPATLVSQAMANELGSAGASVTLQAHIAAETRAQDVREQPVFNGSARDSIEQQIIAELKDADLDRYTNLKTAVDSAQQRFDLALRQVDQKVTALDEARAASSIETTLHHFNEISQPAAIQISDYLNNTVSQHGLSALLDRDAASQHIDQLGTIILDVAGKNGISLATTQERAQQVTQVAANLYNTLTSGIERTNSEHVLLHQHTAFQPATTQLTSQDYNQLVVLAPTSTHDHVAHASLDQQDYRRQREDTERQKQTPGNPRMPNNSSRQPTAQEVVKPQEITQPAPTSSLTGPASNVAELGGGIEDLAAVIAL